MREDKVKVLPNAKDKVDISFDVSMPEPTYGTKAMGETPEVESLWVAVFGSSGFLKEFVQAVPAELERATTNYPSNPRKYKYKVSLSLTESKVTIHFIANPPSNTLPFRNEDAVMSTLMTTGNQDAYWQRIEIDEGIRAYKNDDGDFIDYDNNVLNIAQGDEPVLDPVVLAKFSDIPLIRNFAKIVIDVKSTANFTLKKYAIVNKPKSGSVAPYNSGTGKFVESYQSKTYDALKTNYPGNLPLNAEIDKTIPVDQNDPAFIAYPDPFYIYERPVPTQDPTTIIIWGNYGGDNKDYFYKIDLMDKDGYYAIYRNFKYKIEIQDVVRAGESTPEKAYNSAGSGDVSADVNATNLTDVSDGEARILVSYTDTTLVGQPQYVELQYSFIPHVSQGTVDNNAVTITNKDGSPVTVPGDVIGSDWNANYDNSNGWRTLRFKTAAPGASMKTQEIKVTGSYNSGASKLYRIVTFHLMNIQTLDVVCEPKEVPRTKGSKVDVLIKLPKDLPRSLFPLQLKIEADKKSITPADGDNLPVNPGTTIVTGGSGASYQFIKTLSKDEYDAMQDTASTDKVIVRCHFKTTKDNSAGANDTEQCKVYAVDKDESYFSVSNPPGYFTNYVLREFRNPALTPTNATAADQSVTLSFLMDAAYLPEVKIKLTGLKPADNSLNLVAGTTDTYTYNPGVNYQASIPLLTSNDGGVYSASLSANHYKDAFIANLSYQHPEFTTTSLPFGKDKEVDFSFGYVTQNSDEGTIVIVEDVVFDLTNLKPADTQTSGTFTQLRSGKWLYHPTATELATHTLKFKTEKFIADVSVSMSGNSYNPAGPIKLTHADIDPTYNNPQFTTQTIPFGSNKDVVFTFGYRGTTANPAQEDVVFTLTNLKPSDNDDRFTDLGNGSWLFKPKASDGLNQSITFKTVKFAANVQVDMSGDFYQSATVTKNAPNSFSINKDVLNYEGSNVPGNRTTVSIRDLSTSDSSVGNIYNYSNTVTITFNDYLREDEKVYFRYSSGQGYGATTYYSTRAYTLTELYSATSTQKVNISFTTPRPDYTQQ